MSQETLPLGELAFTQKYTKNDFMKTQDRYQKIKTLHYVENYMDIIFMQILSLNNAAKFETV